MITEEANKAKSDFLANMSRELRTPLNAINGFSQVLLEEYYGPLNDKQKESIQIIYDSGSHLLSLINDILDIAKIESGKMELYFKNVNIFELVEHCLLMVKEKCLVRKINIALNQDYVGSSYVIAIDERRIKQVVYNILSNAIKFSPNN